MIGRFALALGLLVGLIALFGPVSALADTLPDDRAYEMVSPVEKEGADVQTSFSSAGSAIDGNRFFFTSRGSFAGQPTTLATETSPYLAKRGPDGWKTEGIGLPNGALSFSSDGYMGFDPYMSKGVIGWLEDTRFAPYDPAAQPGYNLYMRDSAAGSFELLNGTTSSMSNDQGFKWGSADFGKLALTTTHSLLPGTPCKYPNPCAWEWDHGTLRLASVLPGGEPVNGDVGDAAMSEAQLYYCNFEHAMSDDGSRLFFTTAGGEAKRQLYVRENGTSSMLLSGSERTLPGGASGFATDYQSAEAAHGDKVLFTTRNSLVDADTNESTDLYMYDFAKPAGERLTLISRDENPEAPEGAAIDGGVKGCGGFVGASEDLRRVYFIADNQIIAGAPTAPGPKLYVWDGTGASPEVRYIATLDSSEADRRVWEAPAIAVRAGVSRQSHWSRDGRYLAFISTASLTGVENEGEEEIYRYDAVSGLLVCVTCGGGTVPLHGEVAFESPLQAIKTVNHSAQNVSDGGQVLFQTTRGLIAQDSNGQRDVYEYDGTLHLISRGVGAGPSSFLDATPSGSDIFFGTSDRLVGWDKDGNVDAYDARVGGGLPEPSFTPPGCEGEACLASPVAPDDATPTSFTFGGGGNPVRASTAGCGAGLVRVKVVCRKKTPSRKRPGKKRGKRRHRRQHTHSTRSHG